MRQLIDQISLVGQCYHFFSLKKQFSQESNPCVTKKKRKKVISKHLVLNLKIIQYMDTYIVLINHLTAVLKKKRGNGFFCDIYICIL